MFFNHHITRFSLSFFVLITLSKIAFGQSFNNYYHLRNTAEMAITKNEFQTATDCYSQISSHYDFMYANDCFNATLAAIFARDTSRFYHFFERSLQQGISVNDLLSCPIIRPFQEMDSIKFLKQKENEIRLQYLSSIDTVLRNQIIPIYEREQYFNEKVDQSNWFMRIPLWLKYKAVNKKCISSFIHIVEKNGIYPGERQIGIIETQMYSFDSLDEQYYDFQKSKAFDGTHEYKMFVHYYSLWGKKSFDSLLISAVQNGQLQPRQFCEVSDRQRKKAIHYYSVTGNAYRVLNDNGTSESEKTILLSIINENRKRIGLCSLDDEVTILKYSSTPNITPFIYLR